MLLLQDDGTQVVIQDGQGSTGHSLVLIANAIEPIRARLNERSSKSSRIYKGTIKYANFIHQLVWLEAH